MKKRIFSLLLTAALFCTLLSPCAQAFRYEPGEHEDVAFEDMLVTGINRDGVDEFCNRFTADPVGEYDSLLALFDGLDTQVSLLGILSDCNAGDEAASYRYEQAQNDYTYAADRLYAAISEALAGPEGDALRALMPEGEADSFVDYEAASEEDFERSEQEAALVQEYYLLPYDDDFPNAAAELYLKLAALRREQAEAEGFDSYADYAYASSFAREYVPEDAAHLHSIVKSYIAPLYVKCEWALACCDLPWDDTDIPGGAEVLTGIASYLPDVSPELCEAMDFLLRNGLYRIGDDDNMQEMGYTVSLPAYRSAFLFNKVNSRFEAYQSTVHEFGHFNAAYHDPSPALYAYSDIDISEVQSQGLEMLFVPCLQEILAPGGSRSDRAVVSLQALRSLLAAIVDGCLYDEFEQAVYADPTLTVEDLHALEEKLNAEYGLDELYEPGIFWTYISHLFEQPLYYISYAASALPALDLYLQSQEDYGAAVEAYLNISAANGDDWFLDVLNDNGLCDVTDRRDVARLADALEKQIDALIGQTPADGVFDDINHTPTLHLPDSGVADDILYGVIAALAVLSVILLITMIILAVKLGKGKKQSRAETRDPWEIS